MTDLVQREVAMPDVQQEASFLQVIERASRDPAVDVDKMERLLAMHERMTARQAEVAFNSALAEMQTEFPELPEHGSIKNKNGGVQSKYVLWEDLNQIIKPILTRHGFALTFRTGNEGGKVTVTGILSHRQGHSVQCTMQLPLDDSGSKNGVQGIGSSTAYGKRYTASALLNLTSRGEDNDGQGKTGLTDSNMANWQAAIEACATLAECDALWGEIADATTKAKDVPAYQALHAAMASRRKTLREKK